MKIFEIVENKINQCLDKYVREKNTPQIKCAIKADLMGLLTELQSNGLFRYDFQMPLIDINHEAEIKATEKARDELYTQLQEEEFGSDEYWNISNKMAFKNITLESLKSQIQDPTSINITLKVPITFEPYIWDE